MKFVNYCSVGGCKARRNYATMFLNIECYLPTHFLMEGKCTPLIRHFCFFHRCALPTFYWYSSPHPPAPCLSNTFSIFLCLLDFCFRIFCLLLNTSCPSSLSPYTSSSFASLFFFPYKVHFLYKRYTAFLFSVSIVLVTFSIINLRFQ